MSGYATYEVRYHILSGHTALALSSKMILSLHTAILPTSKSFDYSVFLLCVSQKKKFLIRDRPLSGHNVRKTFEILALEIKHETISKLRRADPPCPWFCSIAESLLW